MKNDFIIVRSSFNKEKLPQRQSSQDDSQVLTIDPIKRSQYEKLFREHTPDHGYLDGIIIFFHMREIS